MSFTITPRKVNINIYIYTWMLHCISKMSGIQFLTYIGAPRKSTVYKVFEYVKLFDLLQSLHVDYELQLMFTFLSNLLTVSQYYSLCSPELDK